MMGALDVTTIVVRPILLLALAATLALALRTASAATRHLVWTAALTGALLLPIAAVVMPGVGVPTPRALASFVGADPVPSDSLGAVAAPEVDVTRVREPDGAPTTSRQLPLAPLAWIWLAGVVVFGTGLAVHVGRLRRRESQWEAVTDGALLSMLDRARHRLGIRRPVRLLRAAGDTMPMTWGLRAARIVLPRGVETWPATQVEAILLHELAHVRRRDVLVHGIAELARALYWFNPLLWYATHRLVVERERACDDEVILAGVEPADYAHQLLEMTRTLRSARATTLAGLAMARRTQISGRLLAVLDPSRPRWTRSSRGVAIAALTGAVALGTAGAVRPRVAVPAAPAATASPPPAAAGLAGADARDPSRATLASGCWDGSGRGRNANRNRDGDRQTAEWRTPRCSGSLVFEDVPTVDRDTTRILAVPGPLRFTERDGQTLRVIEVVPAPAGVPVFRGSANGRALATREVTQWIAASLRPLLRQTGVAVAVTPP